MGLLESPPYRCWDDDGGEGVGSVRHYALYPDLITCADGPNPWSNGVVMVWVLCCPHREYLQCFALFIQIIRRCVGGGRNVIQSHLQITSVLSHLNQLALNSAHGLQWPILLETDRNVVFLTLLSYHILTWCITHSVMLTMMMMIMMMMISLQCHRIRHWAYRNHSRKQSIQKPTEINFLM